MDAKLLQLEETLKRVGFQRDGQDLERLTLQILPNPTPKGERGYPWQLERWDLIRVKGSWFTDKLAIELNRDFFTKYFQLLMKERLSQVTVVEIEDDAGGFWILTEFKTDRKQASLPIEPGMARVGDYELGVFGFHVSTLIEGLQISVNFSNHFAFGATDLQVFREMPQIIAQSLGFSPQVWRSSLFEIAIELKDLILECSAIKSNKQIFQRLFERCHPRRQFKTVYKDQFGWRIFLSSPGVTEFGLVLPPIEVMESRELAQKFREIENAAIQGHYAAARQALVKGMVEHSDSLYLLRRFAYLSLLEGEAVSAPILHAMLKAEPENLLFLSVALHAALQKNQQEVVLQRVSLIGEIISRNMIRFENIRIFEFVLPEILGDGWAVIDPQRAYMCYERILEKRGDNRNILQKMVHLVQLQGDVTSEASLVKRLVRLIQDRGEMASQLIRLAQLLENKNLAESISYAMKAWQIAPHRFMTAEYASELLLRDAQPEKAITVLDETIRHFKVGKSKRKLAELELKVGEIWWLKLHRKDLAQERFKRALILHSSAIDFLHRLIIAYRSMEEKNLEIRIYERIFDLAIRKQIKDEVFKSVAVLVNYYQKEKSNPDRLVHIYQTLIRYYILNLEELFDIINIENIEIDWEKLFESIELQVESDKQLDAKMYYLLLGRIAIQKMDDKELGAKYYEKCIKIGSVDHSVYGFLEEFYSKEKDHESRAKILKIQLKESSGQDRIDLLRQLFYASESFEDPEVDNYALRILIEDRDVEPLKRRFLMYQFENHLVAISRLLASLLEEIRDQSQKIYWLEYVLEILHECDSEAKFEIIQKNLLFLEVLHEDEVGTYEKAIRYHQDNPDSRHLAVYLDRLISRFIAPQIDPQIVLRTLTDDKASKGLYLLQLARQQEMELSRFQNLKKSLNILVNFDEHRSAVIEIYSELCEISLLKVNELKNFYRYCIKADKLSVFTRALISQLKKLPSGTLDLDIFNFVISFLADHQFEAELIVPVLMMGVDDLDPSLRERLKLELFQTLPKKSQYFDAEFGFHFLTKIENWDFSSRFKNMFFWLMTHEKNHNRVKQIAQDMIRSFCTRGDRKKLASLVDFLNQHGIASRQGSWMAFEHFVSHGIIPKSQEQWYEIIRQIESVQDMRALLIETKFLLKGLNTPAQTEDYISYVVEGQLDGEFEEEIRQELLLEYALGLFMSEKNHDLSKEILGQHFLKKPDDPRAWIPLFFLSSTLGNRYDLYDLLKFIIPRIFKNEDLLKSYPVTLESLEKEFQKISRQLNLPEFIPNYNKNVGQTRENISDTERNLKAQSRLASSRGEQTEFNIRVAEEYHSQIVPIKEIGQSEFRKRESTKLTEYQNVAGEPVFHSLRDKTKIGENASSPPSSISSSSISSRPPPSSNFDRVPVEGLMPKDLVESQQTKVNWRLIGASLMAEAGATESLLKVSFDNILEKHFAVQMVAMIEGQLPFLDLWDYKVWRKVENYFYQPEKRMQLGEGVALNGLKQPIAQAIQAMRKVLETAFQHRYTLRGLTDSLQIKIDEFIRHRELIPFTHELIRASGLSFYQMQWAQKSYRIFHVNGLGDQVHYEYQQKVFYLDQDVYSRKPPHFIFHALLQASKAVEKGYYKLTRLSPGDDFLPLFQQLIANFRRRETLAESMIQVDGRTYSLDILTPVDLANLEHDLNNLRSLTVNDIKNTLDDFHTQVMLDCTFETLDLVGIIEHFANKDLAKDEQVRVLMMRDRQIRNLLIHASKFIF